MNCEDIINRWTISVERRTDRVRERKKKIRWKHKRLEYFYVLQCCLKAVLHIKRILHILRWKSNFLETLWRACNIDHETFFWLNCLILFQTFFLCRYFLLTFETFFCLTVLFSSRLSSYRWKFSSYLSQKVREKTGKVHI